MKISVICTGTELLRGATVNTNLAFIGENLLQLGVAPFKAIVVGDEPDDLFGALSETVAESDLVITTGGLGPTNDDLTRDAVCDFFGLKQHKDVAIAEKLTAMWVARGRGCAPENLLGQSMIPENSTVLENRVGTAPGLWVNCTYQGYDKVVVLLPGPPSELHPMVVEKLLPLLEKELSDAVSAVAFMVADTAELLAQQQLEPLVKGMSLSLAYCANAEGVRVFISGTDRKLVEEKALEMKKLFGDKVLEDGLLALTPEISQRLRRAGMVLSTAESCTGGMIAKAITDLPGSSDIFNGAVVSYSNAIKHQALGVPLEVLESKGAVSRECAIAMVKGVCQVMDSQAGIAVTGIAGPGGGTELKPVGLVYIAAKVNEHEVVEEHHFRGDRAAVRERARARSLLLLRRLLLK